MNTILSRHAETRAQQRGIRESDIPLIVAVGTPVDDDSVFLKPSTEALFADNLGRSGCLQAVSSDCGLLAKQSGPESPDSVN